MIKVDILQIGIELGMSYEHIDLATGMKGCLRRGGSCHFRMEAFQEIGVEDSPTYERTHDRHL